MFMKGDKVFDIVRGKGVVESIFDTSFPVNVQFTINAPACTISYTAEGREFVGHALPTLYHGECPPTICAPEPKRMPELEVDAPIIVWDGNSVGVKRHFCRWEGDRAVTWADGTTSWTVDDKGYIMWDSWRLPEEEKDGAPY